MKRQGAWLEWVCLGVEVLAFIVAVDWIANTLLISSTARYFQVFMTLVVSGALIHAFRRWLAEREHEILVPSGNNYSEYQWLRRVRRITWIAWLGLAGVAWAIASQPLWHNMLDTHAKANSMAAMSAAKADARTKDGASVIGNDKPAGLTSEIYLAALGLIVTAVTAFYLVILHRTTDKAEETLEKLGSYHDVLERLKQRARGDQHLA